MRREVLSGLNTTSILKAKATDPQVVLIFSTPTVHLFYAAIRFYFLVNSCSSLKTSSGLVSGLKH